MKTYITPKMKEPELVVHPAGKRDPQGNRIPRKTIQFQPNSAGCGQFTTDDPVVQKFLESHEYIVTGELVVMSANQVEPTGPAEFKTRVGLRTSEPDNPPEPPKEEARPVKAARVKK